ncbi:CocE/NonD family hydrolase [Microbacterium yannicii]|uniref:CocE/NonD family hydrolase n=1 Tax=Microbacterium yannicii TaxID=671622 RepID=A0ABP9M6Z6_9MICO|nr:CocE/NonD family hydrolase [Microbacterium yannicii]MCO5952440.1 CocE/NonD family hydrolase [Microbacterium yannicii]
MIIERDVALRGTQGELILVDVFRPDAGGEVPVIVTMSPYGKDVPWQDRFPLYEQTDPGDEAVWETPFPAWWVERGYAVVRADSPGTGKSPGTADLLGPSEVQAYVDVIEWAGTRPWSNGKVGALGISWLAMLQWHAAARRPPHLAAIIPWEGSSDVYREFLRHGGILSNAFVDFWWRKQIEPQLPSPGGPIALLEEARARENLDDWYEERSPDLERIELPILASGNWGSLVLHQRGILEGIGRAASVVKQLVITSGTHIGPFYEDWAKERQERFLDRWLKGIDNGAEHDPPVRLAIRDRDAFFWRDEDEWPLARTRWTPLHLDVAARGLVEDAPQTADSLDFPSDGRVAFRYTPASETELTGPASLRLWVSSTAHDVDVFVHVHLEAPDGHRYSGIGPQGSPIPLAMGWLRASHRERDEQRSEPFRPVHRHRRLLPLVPGEPVCLDIEIWPTSIVIPEGHALVVEIRGSDDDLGVFAHNDPHDRDPRRFSGITTIHTGGSFDSHLLAPVVPPRDGET